MPFDDLSSSHSRLLYRSYLSLLSETIHIRLSGNYSPVSDQNAFFFTQKSSVIKRYVSSDNLKPVCHVDTNKNKPVCHVDTNKNKPVCHVDTNKNKRCGCKLPSVIKQSYLSLALRSVFVHLAGSEQRTASCGDASFS